MKKFSLIKKLYITVFFLPLMVYCSGIPTPPPAVIYIPGWQNKGKLQNEPVKLLQEIYPGSKITVKIWDSDGDFETCKERADKFAGILADEICAMPQDTQRNIVLIGHSLGGRIAVKTVAGLKEKNVYIRQAVFLGAAIPEDAREIAAAWGAVLEPCINIHNRHDKILRTIYSVFGAGLRDALGSYGYSGSFYGVHMLQYEIKSNENEMANHDVTWYMAKLAEIKTLSGKLPRSGSLTGNPSSSWRLSGQCCNWKIEARQDNSSYRIINSHGQIIFTGKKFDALPLWKQYSTQYRNHTEEMIRKIRVPGGRKMKIIPGGWKTLDDADGWLFQQKKVLLRGIIYRVVDPKDFQRISGKDEKKMRKIFEDIKKQINEFKNSK